MPVDLSKSLVIGISSRALFDLEEANAVFEDEGEDAYAKYQEEHEDVVLKPGTGFRQRWKRQVPKRRPTAVTPHG